MVFQSYALFPHLSVSDNLLLGLRARNISNKDSLLIAEKKLSELTIWIRTLQQALTVEVNRDFINVHGRKENFSSFICMLVVIMCLTFQNFIIVCVMFMQNM